MSAADRLSSEVRSRNLPSRRASAVTFARSTRSSPPGVVRKNRLNPGLVFSAPASSARLRAAESRSESVILASSLLAALAGHAAAASALAPRSFSPMM
jgi:hypothetical protein